MTNLSDDIWAGYRHKGASKQALMTYNTLNSHEYAALTSPPTRRRNTQFCLRIIS